LVTLAVPPLTLDPVLFSDYQQLKRFFSLFLFRDSLARATEVVAADPDGLPGPTVAGLVPWASTWPRTLPGPKRACGSPRICGRAGRPTLYLHGSADGCTGVELIADAERLFPRARA
jgi:hypothetical protein